MGEVYGKRIVHRSGWWIPSRGTREPGLFVKINYPGEIFGADQIPPKSSRLSKSTGFHRPDLYSGESVMTFKQINPAAPPPIIPILLISEGFGDLNQSRDRSTKPRVFKRELGE